VSASGPFRSTINGPCQIESRACGPFSWATSSVLIYTAHARALCLRSPHRLQRAAAKPATEREEGDGPASNRGAHGLHDSGAMYKVTAKGPGTPGVLHMVRTFLPSPPLPHAFPDVRAACALVHGGSGCRAGCGGGGGGRDWF
jgi:hypothetical protein